MWEAIFAHFRMDPRVHQDVQHTVKQLQNRWTFLWKVYTEWYHKMDALQKLTVSDGSEREALEANPPRCRHVFNRYSMFDKPTVRPHVLLVLNLDTLESALANEIVNEAEEEIAVLDYELSAQSQSQSGGISVGSPTLSTCVSEGSAASDAGSSSVDLRAERAGALSVPCPQTGRKSTYNCHFEVPGSMVMRMLPELRRSLIVFDK